MNQITKTQPQGRPVALGIDTGGTYTDAVLVNHASGQVLATAKALTTRHDLAIGIGEAVTAVFAQKGPAGRGPAGQIAASSVVLVGLSTTLATNAMVEGQGGPACLLLIGYDPELMSQYGFQRELGTSDFVYIQGGHTQLGDEAAPLDEAAIRAAALSRRDTVEAFAVSGYFSVRNSSHELRARAIINEVTGRPVTCGYELSSRLNAVRRATTAALNARLIAPLAELIATVRQTLDEHGIAAPLMVVKGDGSLVQAAWAMGRPIETILSGPAASVVGAWHLSQSGDAGMRRPSAWVVDVGGTTTDIAALRDGWPTLNEEGARVGGWRTMVQAIDVHTTGLGGDSHVRLAEDEPGQVLIGPRRVVPLSLLARLHPRVVAELREQVLGAEGRLHYNQGEFVLAWRPASTGLAEADREMLQALAGGPLPVLALSTARHGVPMRARIDDLAGRGLIQRGAFTPTDALHVLGRLDLWDIEAARLGAELLAAQAGVPVRAFCEEVVATVSRRVATELVGKALEDATGRPVRWEQEPAAAALLSRALGGCGTNGAAQDTELGCRMILQRPIVAIGAPVTAYLPQAAGWLGTELSIPPHAEVANAVGAVAGGVIQRAQVVISPLSADDGALRLFLPDGCHDFASLEGAVRYAQDVMGPYVEQLAWQAGAGHVELRVVREDHYAPAASSGVQGQDVYLGSDLVFAASGRPAAARAAEEGAARPEN